MMLKFLLGFSRQCWGNRETSKDGHHLYTQQRPAPDLALSTWTSLMAALSVEKYILDV